MAVLVAGLIIFLGIHCLPLFSGPHAMLQSKLGAQKYRGVFSLIALIGLVLIIVGKAQAEFQALWAPPAWGRSAALPIMYLALILVPAANMPNNIKRWVRHPMLLGIILWAGAHLLANGDLASTLLFGCLGLYSVIDIISSNQRNKNANLPTVSINKDIIAVVVGTIAFAVLLFAHPFLFGVPIHI